MEHARALLTLQQHRQSVMENRWDINWSSRSAAFDGQLPGSVNSIRGPWWRVNRPTSESLWSATPAVPSKGKENTDTGKFRIRGDENSRPDCADACLATWTVDSR
jgi:hypothetical protein